MNTSRVAASHLLAAGSLPVSVWQVERHLPLVRQVPACRQTAVMQITQAVLHLFRRGVMLLALRIRVQVFLALILQVPVPLEHRL